MTDGKTTTPADERLFTAVLTPHRSLSPSGFLILMAAVGTSSLVAGLVFWLIGAWPVIGFMGLDIVLVYLALRLSYRAAGAFEEIELRPGSLLVRKVDAKGRAREFRFQPYSAKLEIDHASGIGVSALRISSHGRRLTLGRFLGPADRESFAAALSEALATARNPSLPGFTGSD